MSKKNKNWLAYKKKHKKPNLDRKRLTDLLKKKQMLRRKLLPNNRQQRRQKPSKKSKID